MQKGCSYKLYHLSLKNRLTNIFFLVKRSTEKVKRVAIIHNIMIRRELGPRPLNAEPARLPFVRSKSTFFIGSYQVFQSHLCY